MKIKILLILALLTAPVFAQNKFYISVGTGLAVPMAEKEFTDAFNLGFNVHGSGTYFMSNNLGVRGDFMYANFPLDEADPDYGGAFTTTAIKVDMLAGNFTGTVQPYGVIGIGANFISASVSQNNVTVSQSETDMGLGLGGGISFVVSPKVNLYLETQYNFIFNEDGAAKGYLPIRGGVSFRVN